MNNIRDTINIDTINIKLGADEITHQQLADATGLNRRTITDFLSGRTEINFYAMLKIVRALFPSDKEFEYMSHYILSSEQKGNIRMALEYSYINDYQALINELTDREMKSTNEQNAKWADNKEMYVLAWIIETLAYYFMRKQRTMMDTSQGLYEAIQEIPNDFIRDSFTSRISLIYGGYYFKLNQLETSREFAQKVIDLGMGQRQVTKAYYLLSLTHSLECGDTALDFLSKALTVFPNVLRSNERKQVDMTRVFLHNFWNKEALPTDDKEELAHRQLIKGNVEEAIKILDAMNEVEKTPFADYYYGKASNDVQHLCRAYEQFLAKGELVYANLLREELLKCEASESFVNMPFNVFYQNVVKGE